MKGLSSSKLSEYRYGVYNDSYVTYAIRFNNKTAIEYLMNRKEISPLTADDDGRTLIHFAIEMGNLSILIYLCEAKWKSSFENNEEVFPFSKLKEKDEWIQNAWKALDTVTFIEGYLPFH